MTPRGSLDHDTLDPHERLGVVLGFRPGAVGLLTAPPDDPAGSGAEEAWRSWVTAPDPASPRRATVGSVEERAGPAALRGRWWAPQVLRGARLDPGRRGGLALVAAAGAAAAVAAVVLWSGRPEPQPVPVLPPVPAAATTVDGGASAPDRPAAAPSGPAAAPAELVVSVVGKVTHPGLVSVRDGARVADVLVAAGGLAPGADASGLNLARKVADGEQVAVGVPAAPDAMPAAAAAVAAGAGGPGRPAGPIELNTAAAGQLDSLPGVGPVMAQRIVEWRTQHGRFTRVEQLREIEGIGEHRFQQLRDLVSVR